MPGCIRIAEKENDTEALSKRFLFLLNVSFSVYSMMIVLLLWFSLGAAITKKFAERASYHVGNLRRGVRIFPMKWQGSHHSLIELMYIIYLYF